MIAKSRHTGREKRREYRGEGAAAKRNLVNGFEGCRKQKSRMILAGWMLCHLLSMVTGREAGSE